MKARRQQRILDLIRQNKVATQGDLAASLREGGFKVTQATVSRDIKELGLIKIPGDGSVFYYAYPGEFALRRVDERLKGYFRNVVLKIDSSENLVVIKTQPGAAQGVAAAIDTADWQEIIGTVGGDDTIVVVIKPAGMTEAVKKRFEELHLRGER